ncbi:bacillithiol system redox-active protein YtxJ [Planomicrobium chinense]|uniref:bacillithiol system redox-active protein YtxJ n=1 Tax=Planococcus chinensis TaxID=272917 RepID=UPI001CC634AA|nr:bacillithiol system redox-active protein YtxJ [Planococcus chinensis]MBZ5202822.1 bacillithiol system redox-active protein YtxJ [Planococcus chinensis]
MENLVRVQDLDSLKQATSGTEHYWLFKHSSTCPVSAAAWNEFNEYCSLHPNQLFLFLVVQEDRELSNNIEALTQIKHESPQLFHFSNQSVDWHASHGDITSKAMQEFIA